MKPSLRNKIVRARRNALPSGWLLPAMLLTVCAAALGVEGAPGEGAQAEKKPDEYVLGPADRRDPFSFTKALPEAPKPLDRTNRQEDDDKALKIDAQQIQARKVKALEHYQLAEAALMNMNATESVLQCDNGLNVFKDLKMNFYKELQDVRDQLLRLRKAADRIHQRQDAERDFTTMNLRLTGVVAREKNSQAIVNAQVVTKGSIVSSSSSQEGAEVVVADILPQQVIFVFRGYRIKLDMSEK